MSEKFSQYVNGLSAAGSISGSEYVPLLSGSSEEKATLSSIFTALGGGGGGGGGLFSGLITVPTLSMFTQNGQSGATYNDSTAGIFALSNPSTGGNSQLNQAAPGSTPWTITALVANISNFNCGIGIYASDGTKLIVVGNQIESGVPAYAVTKWSTYNTFSSTPATYVPMLVNPYTWYQIYNNGTSVSYSISYDGKNFVVVYTDTISGSFLSGGYTNVGFTVQYNVNPAAGTLMSWTT